MGIGVSVFLIALGAILTFGVEASVQGLDLSSIGVILMIVGALGVIVDMVIFGDRRRSTTITQAPARPIDEVVEVRRYDQI
ncbi:MAG: DUF6458 family protein [Acidimicrobiales bacterium]